MSKPLVTGRFTDETTDDTCAAHGITLRQIHQLLDGDHVIVSNRTRRRGLYLLVGRDWGGTGIAAPIERTAIPEIWRVITAWQCKDSEQATLDHKRS